MSKKNLFVWSIILLSVIFLNTTLIAQRLRFTHLRVGIDPVFSPSMLFTNVYVRDVFQNYHNWEANAELIGPYRLSFAVEAGQTNAKIIGNIYASKGTYARVGFNFDLTEPHADYELDLGWRVGYSSFDEGKPYTTPEKGTPKVYSNSAYWSEILLDYKFRIFPKSHGTLRNVMLVTSARIKLNPMLSEKGNIHTGYIPGYGFNNVILPAMQFSLVYTIHLRKSHIHKAYHLNNTYEIIEKDHHIKKVKVFHEDDDEVDRE